MLTVNQFGSVLLGSSLTRADGAGTTGSKNIGNEPSLNLNPLLSAFWLPQRQSTYKDVGCVPNTTTTARHRKDVTLGKGDSTEAWKHCDCTLHLTTKLISYTKEKLLLHYLMLTFSTIIPTNTV